MPKPKDSKEGPKRHKAIFVFQYTYPKGFFGELARKKWFEQQRKLREDMARKMETVNLTRKSIGPADGTENVIQEFHGFYYCSRVIQREDGSPTLLHLVNDEETGEEFELWGCDALDRHIVYFPRETYVELKFMGMKDLPPSTKRKTAQRYKNIRVQCEAGTVKFPEGQENIINQSPHDSSDKQDELAF